jgi:histidinol-phosphatase (PHP family)
MQDDIKAMVDFHVHCEYSADAGGTIEQYARTALKKGLKHICFTTHCDLDPERRHHDGRVRFKGEIVDVTSDWIASYVEEIREASFRYLDTGLRILCGLEMGYTPGIEHLIEPIIDSFPFDFILGGVHTLAGIDIVSAGESSEYFETRTPRQVCEEYYRDLGEAVTSDLFDCIAHIDIYKRCGLDFYGEPLSTAHRGLVEPVLAEIARRDLSLEINSGGLRKGLRWPYPSPDILKAAREAGVLHVTPGSDCHRPEDVGYGLDDCLAVVRNAGYDEIVVFEARAKMQVPIGQSSDKR